MKNQTKIIMTKTKKDVLSQIEALEKKKGELLDKRKNEIWNIFKKRHAVTIDDSLLEGFLAFAMDKQNIDTPIFATFKNYMNDKSVKNLNKLVKY